MPNHIKVTKVPTSKVHGLDFSNIPFGKIFTDHMFVVDYIDGAWVNPHICPLEPMLTHPGNLAWHYGQAIFEGMKATIDNGTPLLFRVDKHIERLNASAERMCMPTIPGDLFHEAVRELVNLDKAWIPPAVGSALYIRPFMYATDESIGVRASDTYRFIIVCLPVGPYYSNPIKLWATEDYVRAVVGGVGEAKTAGNYAASLLPAKMAKTYGCDQVMWLDAIEHKYIQEVGTMNIFFVINGEVVTPATDGAILKGITRDCVITVLKDKGYTVNIRQVSIDEIIAASENGQLQEIFGTGTAAVIAPVSGIVYKDKTISLDPSKYVVSTVAKKFINDLKSRAIEDVYGWLEPIEMDVTV